VLKRRPRGRKSDPDTVLGVVEGGLHIAEQVPADVAPDQIERPVDTPAAEVERVCRDIYEIGLDRVHHVEPKLDGSSSPYRPDTAVDGGCAHGLIVRAASVRGRIKRFHGQAREDDFCLHASTDSRALVVAVADGMGSASRGGLGPALSDTRSRPSRRN
jgi:hypothetical protein